MAYEGITEQYGATSRSVGVAVGAEVTPSGKGFDIFGRMEVRKEDDQ